MNLQFSQQARMVLSSLSLAAVLLFVILFGINSGKNLGQAKTIVKTAESTARALNFFYQDQNRYPSAVEFADQGIMLNYLSNFPLPEFISKTCGQNFVYKRLNPDSFQLSFCLPVSAENYGQGWNSLTP